MNFENCKAVGASQSNVTFLDIYRTVFLEAFLWGLGTAIGELPPYLLARSASSVNSIDEDVE